MNDPGVITGVFSCTKVRNERLEVKKEQREETGKSWKTEVGRPKTGVKNSGYPPQLTNPDFTN